MHGKEKASAGTLAQEQNTEQVDSNAVGPYQTQHDRATLVRLLESAGAHLVPVDGKAVVGSGYPRLSRHKGNFGVFHAGSGTCALDVDDYGAAVKGCAAFGIDLDALLNSGWRVYSPKPNRAKSFFRAPPPQDGEIPGRKGFRASVNGRFHAVVELGEGRSMDVAWGVHPDLQLPWGHEVFTGFNEAPADYLKLRAIFDDQEQRDAFIHACGYDPGSRRKDGALNFRSSDAKLRDRINKSQDMATLLERLGAIRKGNRWLHWDSSSGVPGLWPVQRHEDLWHSVHECDPLRGSFDVYDVLCQWEFGGDSKALETSFLSSEAKTQRERVERLRERAAANEPEPEAPDDTPEAPDVPDDTFERLRLTDLLAPFEKKHVAYIIDQVLEPAVVGVLWGLYDTFKSTTAIDMACSVAFGVSWCGYRCRKGPVVIFAAEGAASLRPRVEAWRLRNRDRIANVQPSQLLMRPAVKLTDDESVKEALEIIERFAPSLIVFDTFSKSKDGDENAASDMGPAIAAARMLADAGPNVLLIHHSTKAGDTARGSGAIIADTDYEFKIERLVQGERDISLECRRTKNAQPFALLRLEMKVEVLASQVPDSFGVLRDICAPVMVPKDIGYATDSERAEKLKQRAVVLDAIAEVVRQSGAAVTQAHLEKCFHSFATFYNVAWPAVLGTRSSRLDSYWHELLESSRLVKVDKPKGNKSTGDFAFVASTGYASPASVNSLKPTPSVPKKKR